MEIYLLTQWLFSFEVEPLRKWMEYKYNGDQKIVVCVLSCMGCGCTKKFSKHIVALVIKEQ